MGSPALSEATLLTRKQAAHYLRQRGCQISAKTLQNMASKASRRKGPTYYKDGPKHTLYDPIDLDAWRSKRLVRVQQ